jgi:NAD(P)-dependent dehydrogenase (short-subunit alcohol dehydrogenase family)
LSGALTDFRGKVAVVTGGASGVGRALAARFAREGMVVILADVEKAALDAAVAGLRGLGGDVSGFATDVSKPESVEALARHCFATHPTVHLLCNNAGIGTDETRTMLWESSDNDWKWAFAVNVWGVLNGIRAFVPEMLKRGEPGRIVNTSSGNGGLVLIPTTPIYATTKSAVSTISEALHLQLQMKRSKLAASVLYPGPHVVATNIFSAARNRPADLPSENPGGPPPTLEDLRKWSEQAGREFKVTTPEEVAEYAFDGISKGRFYLLPESAEIAARIRARVEGVLARRDPTLQLG